MQSLFFPCMKERDKRGSARRVSSLLLQQFVTERHEPMLYLFPHKFLKVFYSQFCWDTEQKILRGDSPAPKKK